MPGLSSYGPAREPLGVRCGRCMRFTGFCLVCTGTLFQALVGGFAAVLQQQEDAAALYAAQHAAHAYTFAPADEATEETRVCLMCVGELQQAAVARVR